MMRRELGAVQPSHKRNDLLRRIPALVHNDVVLAHRLRENARSPRSTSLGRSSNCLRAMTIVRFVSVMASPFRLCGETTRNIRCAGGVWPEHLQLCGVLPCTMRQ